MGVKLLAFRRAHQSASWLMAAPAPSAVLPVFAIVAN